MYRYIAGVLEVLRSVPGVRGYPLVRDFRFIVVNGQPLKQPDAEAHCQILSPLGRGAGRGRAWICSPSSMEYWSWQTTDKVDSDSVW
jgi:hypothetical protein